MRHVKMTNLRYEEIKNLYASMQKKYFQTHKLENIKLLDVMNVFVPEQAAA